MADNDKSKGSKSVFERTDSKSRLAVMPLAVLLPALGEMSQLVSLRADIDARLAEVQADQDSGTEEDVTKRMAEEAMLLQVVQWLNMGGA